MRLWPSIIKDCSRFGIDLTPDDCEVSFASGRVESFGSVKPGQIESDTSIAGRGVLIALAVPTFTLCALGIVFAGLRALSFYLRWRNGTLRDDTADDRANRAIAKMHLKSDDFVLSIVDTQLWLLLAFGISLRLQSMCDLTIYHLNVAMHVCLTVLLTVALAMLLVPSMGGLRWNTVLRVALLIVCVAGLIIFQNEFDGVRIGAVQKKLPASGQDDSLILLRAFCMLESSYNPFGNLTEAEQRLVTNRGLLIDLNTQVILAEAILIAAALAAVVQVCFFPPPKDGKGHATRLVNTNKGDWALALLGAKGIVWFLCLVAIVWNTVAIWRLRAWVDGSGWVALKGGRNPENEIQGIGQLSPLVALGTILGVVLQGIRFPGQEKSDDQGKYEDIPLHALP